MEKEKNIKIICTIGPASQPKEALKKMINHGMNMARLNFSHGNHDFHRLSIKNIRNAAKEAGKDIAIIADLQGPRIRIGDLSRKEILLLANQQVVLFAGEKMKGKKIPVMYESLAKDVKVGDTILVDNGLIELNVSRIKGKDVFCHVALGGVLRSHKGINMPHTKLTMPALTEKDKKDIAFGMENKIDAYAVSFVRSAKDVRELRNLLKKNDNFENIKIISKIESRKAINNFDSICNLSDAIMIARGDLGVEVNPAKVPFIQKALIRKCNKVGKPVIMATQILSSMVFEPRPTRAEVSDIVNAILDGTDFLMLSEETAIGKYPVEAVSAMEKTIDYVDKIISKNEKID